MKSSKKVGMMVATAVAGLVLAGQAMAGDGHDHAAKEGKVKCSGANSCKGSSACGGADNACKGKNSCKGKGWTEVDSEKACTDAGGKVVTAEQKK
jgi:hypothetical protein